MIKKYISMLGVGGCLLLFSCSNDVTAVEGDSMQPILFSASISDSAVAGLPNGVQTKAAATSFPNNGSVVILAANASKDAIGSTKWTASSLFMNYLSATATGTTSPYAVKINDTGTPYYWPFNPDEYLAFAAYSPAIDATLSNDLTDEDAKLTVEVNAANKTFPDLLYSAPTERLNKEHGTSVVILEPFQHAMARVIIRVIPVNEKGEEIYPYTNVANLKIKKLTVKTKVTKGVLNFTAATAAWSLTESADHTLYTIIDNNAGIVLPYNSGKMEADKQDKNEYYILPSTTTLATAERSNIELTITDGVVDYPYSYQVSDFKVDNATPVTLEMGKITTLTFKVRVMEVSTGDTDKVVLMGEVTNWDYKGESNVTIE